MKQGTKSTNIPRCWKKNMEIVWHVKISLETNLLELGLWMTIQSSVQKVHHGRRCTHADLAKIVSDACNKSLS